MLGVAKNENDSCGIQNLIVKKTKSYLLMACGCAHGAAKTMTQVFKEVWVSSWGAR